MSDQNLRKSPSFLHRAVKNNHVNAVITFFIVFLGLYLTICAAFDRNVLHPLTPSDTLPADGDVGRTVVSLLVLLLSSVALGWLFSHIKLPALFGALVIGIIFRNVPLLAETFVINPRWEYIIRLLALACIIIRWGVGLNTDELIKRPVLPFSVGIITPIVESAVIAAAAYFIFNMHFSIAIICGLLMAAVSPAVTVPVMLEMKKQGRGSKHGVPTSILAASSVDNLFCIAAFSSAVSLVFSEEPALMAVIWSIFKVIVGVAGGAFLGWLFWWFPLPSENPAPRNLLLGSASVACVVGLSVIGWATAGIVAAIIFCSLAATKWRKEPKSNVKHLEQSFGTVWNFICLPLLFALIGLKLVFSELSLSAVFAALALIGLGAIARLVSTFFICLFSIPSAESFFVAFSMIPKATVQAALAPGLLLFTTNFPDLSDDLRQTVTACVLTILATAPLGEVILYLLGRVLLKAEKPTFDGVVIEAQTHYPGGTTTEPPAFVPPVNRY